MNQRCEGPSAQALDFLLRGYQARHWAWQARGHGDASEVESRDAHRFAERMGLAERNLLRAAELDRSDPTPHATLISVLEPSDRAALPPQWGAQKKLR